MLYVDAIRMKFIAKCISRVAKFEVQKFCSDSHSSILKDKTVDAISEFK
jgi:hypothetical protein